MNFEKADELDRTLNRVMDMLKYAEAKNAILLTFEAGILCLFIERISTDNLYRFFGIPLYLSIFVILLSFIPNLFKTNNRKSTKNIQFFGDISGLEIDEYKELYFKKINKEEEFYDDLLCQIHYNSKIANKKFKTFRFAISILFVLPIILRGLFILYQKIANRIDRV